MRREDLPAAGGRRGPDRNLDRLRDPGTATPELAGPQSILALQSRIGNRAVASILGAQQGGLAVQAAPLSILRMPGDGDRLKTFRERKLIDDAVFAGLESADAMPSADLVKRLLANFHRRTDFAYTGTAKRPWVNEGDCSTLVQEFVEICNTCFGLDMKVSPRLAGPLFIKDGGKIIDTGARTGNVDRGAHWRFDDHVWASWGGTDVDVLFGLFGALKPSVKITEDGDGNFTVDGVDYYVTDPPKALGAAGSYGYTSAASDRWTPPVAVKKEEEEDDEPAESMEEVVRNRLENAVRVPDELLDRGTTKVLDDYKSLPLAQTSKAIGLWLVGDDGKKYTERFATAGRFGLRYDEAKWKEWIGE